MLYGLLFSGDTDDENCEESLPFIFTLPLISNAPVGPVIPIPTLPVLLLYMLSPLVVH